MPDNGSSQAPQPGQLHPPEHDVLNEDVARLSPLKHANLNVLGRCSFRASTPAGGGLRPLRDPATANADEEGGAPGVFGGSAVRGVSPLREDVVRPQRTTKGKGKELTHSLPFSTYSAPGVLRQDPGRAAESPAEARTCGNQGFAKYVCSCRRVGLAVRRIARNLVPPVGLAVRLRALGAEVRVCAPPDCAEQLAGMQPC